MLCRTVANGLNSSSAQEPDEDDMDDDEEGPPADLAEAARAAGIDVRTEGAVAEDSEGGGGGGDAAMLNVQEMRRDAFWLQRRISRAMPEKEADAAQQLAESVFAALQARFWALTCTVLGLYAAL